MEINMRILLIDGQGGKMGKQLAESIIGRYPEAELTAVGTNSTATEAMLKGGARLVATGENAIIVGCRKADIVIGPIGIVIADSMLGEITPKAAVAVAQSEAVKILIPVNRCNNLVAGVGEATTSSLISDALDKIGKIITNTERKDI